MTPSPNIEQLVKSLRLASPQETQLLKLDVQTLEEVVPLIYKLTKNRPNQSPALLFELCAKSDYSLSDWCEALLALYTELATKDCSAHLNSALHYLHCCAQVSNFNSLKTTVVEYLRLYGMEDSFCEE